ncbi:ER-golgi trafficking TRAPP I complex 85 kDa subunit-domain-containing protein [Entophlyctis helioformis]|nr:ER-golgi trafficking TRAPP I complex 85 kDa subunit-domain-containing protein [Entophlyctis helioformis]
MDEGRDFLARVASPLVAVVADPLRVPALLAKSNVPDMALFLRPFGFRHHSGVTVTDMHGATAALDPCYIRFVEAHAAESPDPALFQSVLAADVMARYNAAAHVLPALRTIADVESFRETAGFEAMTPWFSHYRNLVALHTGASEHDTFNHPVACLVVVSTSDPSVVATAQSLLSESNLPSILMRPYMDPSVLRLYLLLHDPEEAPNADPAAILADMQRAGLQTHLLTINSQPAEPDQKPIVPDVWSPFIAETAALNRKLASSSPIAPGLGSTLPSIIDQPFQLPSDAGVPQPPPLIDVPQSPPALSLSQQGLSHGRGLRLSVSDFQAVDVLIKDFLLKQVLDRITRQMRDWERDIASARRGLSGRLFKVGLKYFGASKSAAPAPSAYMDMATRTTVFPFASPELIMRRLGDYAVMIRDYKYALTVYESVKKDFSANERYVKFYAGVQEMIAVAALLVTDNPNKTGVESALEASVQAYTDAKCPIYATRAALLVAEMTKEHHAYRDAASLLIKNTAEDADLKSALFLESAAICFLQSNPPLPRKYVFHLILAGHRFAKAGLRDHAQRNYVTGLSAYGGLGWSLVDDHIHFALGRQSYHLGQVRDAVLHFIKLLRRSRQTASAQRAYLAEFVYIYQQYGAAGGTVGTEEGIPAIPLPVIVDGGVTVQSGSLGSTGGSGSANAGGGDDEAIWEAMEKDLLDFAASGGDAAAVASAASKRKTPFGQTVAVPQVTTLNETTTAVGEPVTVNFQWQNPLQVPVPANNLYLECAFGDAPESVTDLQVSPDSDVPSKIERPEFDVEVLHDVSLDANEKRKVQLKIYPKREGTITILGIRYLLCGVIPTYHRFHKRGRRLNDTPAQRQDPDGVYAPDVVLKVVVTPPMPVLDVLLHGFPDMMLSGQVIQVALELNNKGSRGLKSLYVKTSHPAAFCFGDGTSLELPSYASVNEGSVAAAEEEEIVGNALDRVSCLPLRLPLPDGVVQPGSKDALGMGVLPAAMTTLVPVWIRAEKAGRFFHRMVFVYQSEDQGGYRFLRYTIAAQVYPSLRINTFTRTSLTAMNEFILGVEMENQHPSLNIVFRQITSISPSWKIEPLSSPDEPVSSQLGPNQTQYQYFRIKRCTGRQPLVVHQTPELVTTTAIERLIYQDAEAKFAPPDIRLVMHSLGAPGQMSSSQQFPLSHMVQSQRFAARLATLASQYPSIPARQLSQLFTLYWTDDLDLLLFWEAPQTGQRGHIAITGTNLNLYSPLPLSAWFGRLDARTLAGRALFSATVRERTQLVTGLLKSRAVGGGGGGGSSSGSSNTGARVSSDGASGSGSAGSGAKESSPVRVLVKAETDVVLSGGPDGVCVTPIRITLGNTSWMHVAEYTFEALSPSTAPQHASFAADAPLSQAPLNFAWVGQTHFSGLLQPESSVDVLLHASFATPGMFDVNRWRLHTVLSFSPAALLASVDGGRSSSIAGEKTGVVFVQTPTIPQHVLVTAGHPVQR